MVIPKTKLCSLKIQKKDNKLFLLSVLFLTTVHLQISTGFATSSSCRPRRTFRNQRLQTKTSPGFSWEKLQMYNPPSSVLLYQTESSSSNNGSTEKNDSPTTTRNTNWQSYISRNPESGAALYDLLAQLRGDPPDIVFLFIGQHHSSYFSGIVQEAQTILCGEGKKQTRIMALVGGGVIGGGAEVDEPSLPSMSILCGKLPKGANVELFDFNELHKPPPSPESEYWERLATTPENDDKTNNNHDNDTPQRPPSFILFADPWSPVEKILKGLDGISDGSSVVAGGMSVPRSTQPTVAIDGRALPQGSAVGMCLRGTVGLQAVVAQGCRPVGPTFTVTAHEGNNVLTELDGKPALDCLEQVATDAPEQDKSLISAGYLLCGITPGITSSACDSTSSSYGSLSSSSSNNNDNQVGNEMTSSSPPQDFLVRQIMGFQPNKGGVVVAGEIKDGMYFRFHVKDRNAALDDMDLMVQRAKSERLFSQEQSGIAMAAMQISCVGRGRSLFGRPNADLAFVSQLFADESNGLLGEEQSSTEANNDGAGKPISGFFGNAEYGPVGLSGFTNTCPVDGCEGTFVHGFTTVVAMLCDYSQQSNECVGEALWNLLSLDEPADAWG